MLPDITPRNRIKGMLRQIFLRSKERQQALQKTGYCCERCGVKQSAAKGKVVKLNVHHIHGIKVWDKIIEMIYDELLCPPNELEVLCVDCHKEEHEVR
jgi:predicted HNH restriction endonuclease